jgi:competence protein ComGC
VNSGKQVRAGGFGSVVMIVVSMLIGFLLIVFYLREFVPSSGPGGGPKGTVDAVKRQAQAFEEQQRRRLEQMNEVTK